MKTKSIIVKIIRFTSYCVNFFCLICILMVLGYGIYAIWDSYAVIKENASSAYKKYKPTEESGGLSFEELQKLNPDVIGWITLDDTPVDYPLVRGSNNKKYINTSPEGKFSLTGSIFMDYRNDASFKDFNTIIYGHNMDPNVMFGVIKEYYDEAFFLKHRKGEIFFDGEEHELEIVMLINGDGYDFELYSVCAQDNDSKKKYLEYLNTLVVFSQGDPLTVDDTIVLLSTCSPDETNGRNILVGRILNISNEEDQISEEKDQTSNEKDQTLNEEKNQISSEEKL